MAAATRVTDTVLYKNRRTLSRLILDAAALSIAATSSSVKAVDYISVLIAQFQDGDMYAQMSPAATYLSIRSFLVVDLIHMSARSVGKQVCSSKTAHLRDCHSAFSSSPSKQNLFCGSVQTIGDALQGCIHGSSRLASQRPDMHVVKSPM